MQLQITCRHFSAPVELQDQAEKKFGKLKQFDSKINQAIIVIQKENNDHQIELRFESHGKNFIIKSNHESIYSGFDTILDKAVRQVKKHIAKGQSFPNDKIVNHLS